MPLVARQQPNVLHVNLVNLGARLARARTRRSDRNPLRVSPMLVAVGKVAHRLFRQRNIGLPEPGPQERFVAGVT